MRSLKILATLLLSPLTLMCSAPENPAPPAVSAAGTPGAGTSSAGTSSTGGGGAGGAGGNTAPGAGTGGETGGAAPAGGSGGGGSGGTAGAGGGSSLGLPTRTAGCDMPDPIEEPQAWLENDITVANLPAEDQAEFGQRRYWVRLPVAYDHTKNYPLVFYGPGCGAGNVEGTPMMDQIKNDAIHVFLLQVGGCFSTGYPSPEVPYFTQALDEVQAKYCTDANRVFVSGYSSGAWLSNMLACAMGPRIRGIGTAAGGLGKSNVEGYNCAEMGSPAAGVFYTGENDTENPANDIDATGFNSGVVGARDRLIHSNGCDANAMEDYADNPICKIWKTNCPNNPVLYCVGPGDGHGNGGGEFGVSNGTFWDVWSPLPPN